MTAEWDWVVYDRLCRRQPVDVPRDHRAMYARALASEGYTVAHIREALHVNQHRVRELLSA